LGRQVASRFQAETSNIGAITHAPHWERDMTTLMDENSGLTRFIICFVLIAFTAGCTSMRPIYGTDAASYSAQIEVGDKIEIARKDLTTVKFKVTDMSNDGISGKDTFVAYSDIQTIQTVKSNTGVILGIVGVGVLLGALLAVGSAGGLGLEGFSLQ